MPMTAEEMIEFCVEMLPDTMEGWTRLYDDPVPMRLTIQEGYVKEGADGRLRLTRKGLALAKRLVILKRKAALKQRARLKQAEKS